MLEDYRNRLRKAIDSLDLNLVEVICIENPGAFFTSLDARKMGKKRLSTLYSIAYASLNKRRNPQCLAFEKLIIEQIKLSSQREKIKKEKPIEIYKSRLEAYKASLKS